jgi:subtilisin family serine protease
MKRILIALLALGLGAAVPARVSAADSPAAKRPVTKLDDLPRHTYAVALAPSAIVENDAAFQTLAAAVKRDIAADLAGYDIQDRTTLQRFKVVQLQLAVIAGDFASARRLIAELRDLEEKPNLKLTTGLVTEIWMDTHDAGVPPGQFAAQFEARFAKRLQALPWDVVQNDLKQMKGSFEITSRALVIGGIAERLDPAALQTKTVSADAADQIVGARYRLLVANPLKDPVVAALERVISAHRVAKVDRWSPRLVTLTAADHGHPVLIGIWDSGSDTALFADQLFTDSDGRHGFAYDLDSNPVPELLQPLGPEAPRRDQEYSRIKGFLDVRANVDSPEAAQLKRFMSALQIDQVKPTLEELSLVSDYSHGTHVTGIALAGNPYARLVVGRITFDYHLIPEKPTIEQARKDAAAFQAQADYFRSHGVRVVNMSWGDSLKSTEDSLEANGAGGTAAERAKLARQIFDLRAHALYAALKSAPDTLFVTAAGNDDNNVKFDEFIPSSFQLPNMITVGAVDEAGEETSFSSFGPMVNVHANGFEVESFIPGGARIRFSGTSMAAPQVTNLAGKLFALDPGLTVAEAKQLILDGCDQGSRVHLINPAKSVALLRARLSRN